MAGKLVESAAAERCFASTFAISFMRLPHVSRRIAFMRCNESAGEMRPDDRIACELVRRARPSSVAGYP